MDKTPLAAYATEKEMLQLDLLKAEVFSKQVDIRRKILQLQHDVLVHLAAIEKASDVEISRRRLFASEAMKLMTDDFEI
jgi:hypothetical protein